MLAWWPLGTHPALYGTNYDLPVSQVDFFGTFADILGYPLPTGSDCVYAYNSRTAHVQGHDAAKIGRPAKTPKETNFNWLKRMENFNFDDKSNSIFDSSVVVRARSGRPLYELEVETVGFDRTEQWLTMEEDTGFMLGWDGCMAEDSQSFKAAFEAVKTREFEQNGEMYHQFENKLKQVPSKIMVGLLGGTSIRFGRYKLIRYGAPKDRRTGDNRQHLIDHEGLEWHNAPEKMRCKYDLQGRKLTPGNGWQKVYK